jgi:uncharacterized protein YabN with tetrapyrrole methylase and pyrophosphatase domain
MLKRGVALGWDWLDIAPRRGRLKLELDELDSALDSGDPKAIADEIGDVFIVMVSLALVYGVDPNAALWEAIAKVNRRLEYMERIEPDAFRLTVKARESLWQKAKEAVG